MQLRGCRRRRHLAPGRDFVFNCNAGLDGPAIGAVGSLVKSAAGTTSSFTAIDNDGVLSVQAGTLQLLGADDATSAGSTPSGLKIAGLRRYRTCVPKRR